MTTSLIILEKNINFLMAVDIRFDLKTRIYRFAGAQTVFDVFKNNEDRFSGTYEQLLVWLDEQIPVIIDNIMRRRDNNWPQ
jgi:hypothetical protein